MGQNFKLVGQQEAAEIAPKIREIFQQAFVGYADAGGLEHDIVDALNETNEDIINYIHHDKVFVAEVDGKIIGTVRANRHEHEHETAVLSRLAVLPEYQGQGVGSYILDCFCEFFQKTGDVSAIQLYVSDRVAKNKHFYGKRGFTITETFKVDDDYGYRTTMVRKLK